MSDYLISQIMGWRDQQEALQYEIRKLEERIESLQTAIRRTDERQEDYIDSCYRKKQTAKELSDGFSRIRFAGYYREYMDQSLSQQQYQNVVYQYDDVKESFREQLRQAEAEIQDRIDQSRELGELIEEAERQEEEERRNGY